VEYKNYLGTVGRNQIRMWQLSAVKYIAAPAAIMQQLQQNPELGKQFKPVLNYQVPTAQGMRQDVLLDFKGSIPRFSIYKNWEVLPVEKHCEALLASQHNPLATVLVGSDFGLTSNPGNQRFTPLAAKTTKKNAIIYVETDAPGIVRFSQRFEDVWRVFVDNKPAPLLRLDYLSMGVRVPAGSHKVEFRCADGRWNAIMISSVVLASVGAAVFLINYRTTTS